MTEQAADEPIDFVFLDEAAKKLLGYYVYRRFHAYLSSISVVLHQQYQEGFIEGLSQPTARGRATLFDFRTLDFNVSPPIKNGPGYR